MKRILVLVLTLALCLSLATPLLSAQAEGETEMHRMLFVTPGDPRPDDQMVTDLLNEKMKADGLDIYLERQFIPFSVWGDKLNMMLTSGEEFDLFHIMQDYIPYSSYQAMSALTDITDLLPQYGEKILELVPESMLKDSAINERNYIIPTYWIELACDNMIYYREDVFKKYNLEIPQTRWDILTCYETVRSQWEGVNPPILLFRPSYSAETLQMLKIHREYESWPFNVNNNFFMVHQTGEVESWFESEEFKLDCEWMREAYLKGIIQPDVLTVDADWITNYDSAGTSFLWYYPGLVDAKKNNPDVTADDRKTFMLAPEKDIVREWGVKNCNGVSITSQYPQGAIKFINWLWSAQENYDLYMYGIEGTHWQRDEADPRGIIPINDPVTNQNGYATGDDWKIGTLSLLRYNTDTWSDEGERYVANEKAINALAGAFFFNPEVVSTEYANLQAEAATVMTPIAMGVVDYAENIDDAIARLKTAGLDVVMEEYNKQFSEFLKTVQ